MVIGMADDVLEGVIHCIDVQSWLATKVKLRETHTIISYHGKTGAFGYEHPLIGLCCNGKVWRYYVFLPREKLWCIFKHREWTPYIQELLCSTNHKFAYDCKTFKGMVYVKDALLCFDYDCHLYGHRCTNNKVNSLLALCEGTVDKSKVATANKDDGQEELPTKKSKVCAAK